MAVITDIKQQRRSTQRYSVYVDGQYAFALSDLDLSTSNLRIGSQLSAEEIEQWQGAAAADKAYNLAIRQLSYRPRSRREIADYLRRKEQSPELIEAVLSRLAAAGLVDDAAFARSWIASRQLLKPRSRRVLGQELIQKGLDRETIETALGEVSSEDDLEVLVEMARRKQHQSQYAAPEKLMAYLARQGFRYDQIKEALSRLDD